MDKKSRAKGSAQIQRIVDYLKARIHNFKELANQAEFDEREEDLAKFNTISQVYEHILAKVRQIDREVLVERAKVKETRQEEDDDAAPKPNVP